MGNTLFTLSHLFLKVILKNNHRYFDVNLQLKSQARKRKIASSAHVVRYGVGTQTWKVGTRNTVKLLKMPGDGKNDIYHVRELEDTISTASLKFYNCTRLFLG